MEKLPLPADFKDFLRLLNSAKVEYLLVGGVPVLARSVPCGPPRQIKHPASNSDHPRSVYQSPIFVPTNLKTFLLNLCHDLCYSRATTRANTARTSAKRTIELNMFRRCAKPCGGVLRSYQLATHLAQIPYQMRKTSWRGFEHLI